MMDRREFTLRSALALLSGVTITVWGCGDGDGDGNASTPTGSTPSPSPSPQPPPSSGVTGTVGSNHGHIAQISAAELQSGGDLTLDIEGGADHPHTVMLTAAELSQIASGTRVSKQSSVNVAHAHTVTFN